MAQKRYGVEQIVPMLRRADIECGSGVCTLIATLSVQPLATALEIQAPEAGRP